MSRIDLLIIDKDMNTLQVNLPTFMLNQINYDNSQVKKHKTKATLTQELTEFLKG